MNEEVSCCPIAMVRWTSSCREVPVFLRCGTRLFSWVLGIATRGNVPNAVPRECGAERESSRRERVGLFSSGFLVTQVYRSRKEAKERERRSRNARMQKRKRAKG